MSAKIQSVEYGNSLISVIEERVGMMLEWRDVNAGAVLNMSLPVSNTMLLKSMAETWSGSLTIDRLFEGEIRQAVIKDIFLQPGESISFGLQDSGGGAGAERVLFTTDAAAAEQLKLALARSGGDGYRNMGTSSAGVSPGSSAIVTVPTWSGSSGLCTIYRSRSRRQHRPTGATCERIAANCG